MSGYASECSLPEYTTNVVRFVDGRPVVYPTIGWVPVSEVQETNVIGYIVLNKQ